MKAASILRRFKPLWIPCWLRWRRKGFSPWKSFNEARRAAACWNVDDSRIHYFEKLGVYRFLSYEVLRPELVIFYNETLKVLVDYDHDRDSELVHTLALYFKCGGNLKRLAEEMGVHYNTVAYRIHATAG